MPFKMPVKRPISPPIVEAEIGVAYKDICTNQLFVDVNGNDTTGDGSVEKPFLTLQKAHDVAPEGIVINLGAGLFTGNITITKPSIIWTGKKLTLINGLIDISGSAGYGNFFKDISLQDIGSGVRNALTVHTGAHAVLINSEIETNAEVGSRCIKVDGGQVDLVTTTMVENASNPITIDAINSATVNAMGSMLTGVSIPVGSYFNHFGTIFERADSVIDGTELNDYIASEIVNDSAVAGATVKDALDELNSIKVVYDDIKYYYDESLGESYTTEQVTYQNKVTLALVAPVAGDYMLEWDAQVSASAASTSIMAKVRNNKAVPDIFYEGRFSSGGVNYASNGWVIFHGFAKLTLTTDNLSFFLDWMMRPGTVLTAYIKNAKLLLRRIV